MLEDTQPHTPKHRRDGVPLDGAPDLGVFASGLRGEPTGGVEVTIAPSSRPEPLDDLELSEFGEDPDTELAG